MEKWLESIDGNVPTLVAALNLGRGVWKTLIILGGAMVAVGGFVAWVTDHLRIALR